jgi:hypothetical protein
MDMQNYEEMLMLPKGNVQMKKPPRREKANVLHLDPYASLPEKVSVCGGVEGLL